MTQVVSQQNDTLDLVCWRYYGRTAGATEEALLLNPGLAKHGPIIPYGTSINLPDSVPAPIKETINLWT